MSPCDRCSRSGSDCWCPRTSCQPTRSSPASDHTGQGRCLDCKRDHAKDNHRHINFTSQKKSNLDLCYSEAGNILVDHKAVTVLKHVTTCLKWVIFKNTWLSHLSIWQRICHFLFLRLRCVTALIWTPTFRMRGKRSNKAPPRWALQNKSVSLIYNGFSQKN